MINTYLSAFWLLIFVSLYINAMYCGHTNFPSLSLIPSNPANPFFPTATILFPHLCVCVCMCAVHAYTHVWKCMNTSCAGDHHHGVFMVATLMSYSEGLFHSSPSYPLTPIPPALPQQSLGTFPSWLIKCFLVGSIFGHVRQNTV